MNATQASAADPSVKLKLWKQPSRGFTLNFQVPADAHSFDAVAGKEGALLKHGTAEGIYRSSLPKVWKLVLEKAPAIFDLPLERDPKKDKVLKKTGETREGFEGIEDYLPRLKKHCTGDPEQGLPNRLAELSAFVQSCADEVGFDLSTTERVKKPEPVFYDLANQIVAKVAAGDSDWQTVLDKCAAKGATSTFEVKEDGTVDIDELAQVIKEAQTAKVDLA